jgi:hypothetical protein
MKQTIRTKKNMPDYYMVKYSDKNNPKNINYGIQDRFHKQAEKVWVKENALLIEDAISGQIWKIHLELFNIKPIEFGDYDCEAGCSNDEYSRFINKVFKAAHKKSESLKGFKVGKLIRLGVGDGLAFYEVTKVKGKNCRVEWRGFGGDRYFDQVLGGGGDFPKHVIERLIY